MKQSIEKKKLPVIGDVVIPSYEPDENQEYDKSEYEEDNFYSFLEENQNSLVEGIRKWEECRFMV